MLQKFVLILPSIKSLFLFIFLFPSQFSCSVMSNPLRPHGLQHARLPCPLPTPGAYSNSCPLSWWCHPTILSSVVPFFSCFPSFPASESVPIGQFFASGGQSVGASVSYEITIWSSNPIPGHINRQNNNSKRNMHHKIHRNTVHSSQDMGTS